MTALSVASTQPLPDAVNAPTGRREAAQRRGDEGGEHDAADSVAVSMGTVVRPNDEGSVSMRQRSSQVCTARTWPQRPADDGDGRPADVMPSAGMCRDLPCEFTTSRRSLSLQHRSPCRMCLESRSSQGSRRLDTSAGIPSTRPRRTPCTGIRSRMARRRTRRRDRTCQRADIPSSIRSCPALPGTAAERRPARRRTRRR